MNLDAVKGYKVLLVGDAIIDEYYYVTTIGKSIKEPVISTLFESYESFHGGVWAAAAHIKDLCSVVDVMTGPVMMKNTRFIDLTGMRKLFTTHKKFNGLDVEKPTLPIRDYDVVIVADFGHGTMTDDLIDQVMSEARFLAVNTQTNSQNFGFNVITKYRRSDFVVLDELEARLALHDNESPLEDIILRLGYPKIIITMGSKGAIGYDGSFYSEPAQTINIVDTMGAGDAVLAVSSPFAAAKFSMRDLVRIGNAAGAVKVGILGHQKHVTRAALEAQLEK